MSEFASKFVVAETNPTVRSLIAQAMRLRAHPEQFIKLFHADAALHMVGDRRDSPFYGLYRGHDQILTLLRNIDAEFERRDHRVLNAVVDGDCFALRRVVALRHRGTSQSSLLVIGHLVRTRAGLIDQVFEYADTDTMRRLLVAE